MLSHRMDNADIDINSFEDIYARNFTSVGEPLSHHATDTNFGTRWLLDRWSADRSSVSGYHVIGGLGRLITASFFAGPNLELSADEPLASDTFNDTMVLPATNRNSNNPVGDTGIRIKLEDPPSGSDNIVNSGEINPVHEKVDVVDARCIPHVETKMECALPIKISHMAIRNKDFSVEGGKKQNLTMMSDGKATAVDIRNVQPEIMM